MALEQFKTLVREDVPLAPFTWLQLGGHARYFAEPADVAELRELLVASSDEGLSVRLLGGGSNLLVRDAGFDGLVIQLKAPAFSKIQFDGSLVTCGGGAPISHLITACVGQGLAGVEHLVGIPGTVGGALHGNSGTDEGDIGHVVRAATLLRRDGSIVQVDAKELAFSHRRSSLDELVILEATFELQKDDAARLTKREQTFWILKRSKHPNAPVRSAIAFTNPDGASAADLLQRFGQLGAIEGSVQLNPTYPNYITVSDGATSEQVLALLELVREAVFEKSGVRLLTHLVVW